MIADMVTDEQIDDRVVPLVEELNRFPGVETFASCGGHRHVHVKDFCAGEKRGRIGQVRYPDFYVSFMIDPSPEAGWSLRLISWATYEASATVNVRYGAALIMWAPTPEPAEPPRFDLYGRIDVGLVLRMLRQAREEHLRNAPSAEAGDELGC